MLTSAIGTWPGRALLAALVAMVVGVPVVVGRITAAPAAPEVRTAPVTRGTVTQLVAVSGSVNAGGTSRSNFQTSGRVIEILVKVGDRVTAGQVLARLDTATLEVALAQAQANVASAQARYEQTIAGALPQDVALARLSVDNAQRSLEQTRKTTVNDIEGSKLVAETARRSLDQTQRTAASDLANAQATLARVSATYTSSKAGVLSLTGTIATETGTFDSEVERARAQLQVAIDDLAPKTYSNDSKAALASLYSAQSSLTNASTYVSSGLRPALTEYTATLADLLRTIVVFDLAIGAGQDTSAATAGFQTAQLAYTTAATKLSAAFDAPNAQLAAAQTSVTSAQASLNTTSARSDTNLEGARGQLLILQATLTSDQQRAALIKSRITQTGSTLASLTDAIGGSYLSAINAVSSTRTKNESSLSSAQTAITKAQQDLSSAEERAKTSVVSSENSLESARLSLAKTNAGPTAYDIAAAYASVLGAQVSADQAQLNLTNATLRAPTAGVVATLTGQVGENAAGTTASPFISIANVTTLALHGTVGEADVAKLRLGQVATVTVDAVGSGSRMTGKVALIDPVATIQQGVPVYGVDITVDVPEPQVRPGMSGTANVILLSRTNVLTVPNLAIRTVGGRRGVQVMRGGAAVDAEVVLGVATDTVTEVVSGLQEGELVVLPQARTTTAPAQNQLRIPGGAAPAIPGR